jgi:hypothetical protein
MQSESPSYMTAETILGQVTWTEDGWWEPGHTVSFWFDDPEGYATDLSSSVAREQLEFLNTLIQRLRTNTPDFFRKTAERQIEFFIEFTQKTFSVEEIVQRMAITHISFNINELTVIVRAMEEDEDYLQQGYLLDYWVSFDEEGNYLGSCIWH